MRSLSTTLALATSLVLAAGCSSKKSSTDTTTPGTGGTVAGGAAGGAGTDGSVDPSQSAAPAQPTGQDVASNPDTQGQVVAGGLNTAASAAAAGAGGGGGGASLALDDAGPKETVASGSLVQDCYTGTAHIQGPGRPNSLVWPEASTGEFADSTNAAGDSTTMNVETALLQYPAKSPTATLDLSVPFNFGTMAEVIAKDTRTVSITLADKAQTSVQSKTQNEAHRFWVARNPIGNSISTTVGCVGTGSTSGTDGKFAKIKWSDDNQVNGLNLLERFTNSGAQTRTFLLRGTTPYTLAATLGQTGERLVQWTTSTESASAVSGATIVRQKMITHVFNEVNELTDSSGTVRASVNALDEVRATTPLVIQEFRDATETPLQQVIQSGSVLKTGKDSSGTVKWFAKLDFSGLAFDLKNSTDVCTPVAGTVTMTVFDKEGGTQLKQISVAYSSAASAVAGKVDPQIAVTGDDANGTQAQWIKLHVNERCDLKN